MPAAQSLSEQDWLEIEREYCARSLSNFVRAAWPVYDPTSPLVYGWHIDAICEHLEAITRGEITRLLINIPPGCMKSSLTNVLWPCWEWGPLGMSYQRIISAAHEQGLAIRDNRAMRRVVQSDWFQQLWPIEIASDQNQKCLVAGTMVTMGDGARRPIEEVRAGDKVLSYDFDRHGFCVEEVENSWLEGEKECARVTLNDGSVVEGSTDHRMYGWDDWVYLDGLVPGDPMAVTREMPEQTESLDLDDVFLVALWLAEGTKAATSYQFSNIDPEILARTQRIALNRGWEVRSLGGCVYSICAQNRQSGDTPMGVLKQFIGEQSKRGSRGKLARQSIDSIKVPDSIMRADCDAVKEFLGTYIACDGSVTNSKNCAISATSVSRPMADDLQALLKRLGARARIETSKPKYRYRGEHLAGASAYKVVVSAAAEIVKLSSLYLFGKSPKLSALVERCIETPRKPSSGAATIPPGETGGRWRSRQRMPCTPKMEGPLDWRKVKSVERTGRKPVYHLQVSRTSVFFANGALSHNTYFENDSLGFRQACAVSSMTGKRGHRVLWDDPLSAEDADSDAKRETVLREFQETLPSRYVDQRTSANVIVMQRLHQNDPAGFILEHELGYEHLMLPMEFERDRRCMTSIGFEDPRTEEGELLFPERFPADTLERDKSIMTEYAVAGQFQQRPAPRGGGMFPVDRFEVTEHPPQPKDIASSIRFWDKAGTSGGGAYTAGVLMHRLKDGRYFIEDVQRGQWGALDRESKIRHTADVDGHKVQVWVEQEPGSGGKESAESTIRNLSGFRAFADRVTGDKETRAEPYAAQVQGGNIMLLRASWNRDFLQEHETFPSGTYKDQVDAAAGAFAKLAQKAPSLSAWT